MTPSLQLWGQVGEFYFTFCKIFPCLRRGLEHLKVCAPLPPARLFPSPVGPHPPPPPHDPPRPSFFVYPLRPTALQHPAERAASEQPSC